MVYNTGACYQGYGTIEENACVGWNACKATESNVNIENGACVGNAGKFLNNTVLIFQIFVFTSLH